jgi:hypothetical protein
VNNHKGKVVIVAGPFDVGHIFSLRGGKLEDIALKCCSSSLQSRPFRLTPFLLRGYVSSKLPPWSISISTLFAREEKTVRTHWRSRRSWPILANDARLGRSDEDRPMLVACSSCIASSSAYLACSVLTASAEKIVRVYCEGSNESLPSSCSSYGSGLDLSDSHALTMTFHWVTISSSSAPAKSLAASDWILDHLTAFRNHHNKSGPSGEQRAQVKEERT